MFLISIATSIHGGPKIDMGEAIVVFHCPDQIIILSSSESLRLHSNALGDAGSHIRLTGKLAARESDFCPGEPEVESEPQAQAEC